MNPRENILRTINFNHPARVPGNIPGVWLAYRGCGHEAFDPNKGFLDDRGHQVPTGTRWNDLWGTGWHKESDGWMGYPEQCPLRDLTAALPSYRWPDPNDERLLANLATKAQTCDRSKEFLCCNSGNTLWERAYMLVGMENLMCALLTEPQAVRDLLHGIMDFQLGMARHYLDLGVELAALGDDLGSQDRLLFSRDVFLAFFVPEYRRLFDLYRSRGVRITFHSCGHIEPILDVLMDLGVDVLNPIQASANDLSRVRAMTQGRMTLWGGVSSSLIMAGAVEAIRAEVRRCIRLLARDGGYICGPDQGLPFPLAHKAAMDAAIEKYGVYPLG